MLPTLENPPRRAEGGLRGELVPTRKSRRRQAIIELPQKLARLKRGRRRLTTQNMLYFDGKQYKKAAAISFAAASLVCVSFYFFRVI
jgi:hypothetical protein